MTPDPDAHWPTDLAGDIEVQVSDSDSLFIRNQVAVIVEQRLRKDVRYGGCVVVQRQLLADNLMMEHVLGRVVDGLRPWSRPDRNPMPMLAPFRLLQRLSRFRLFRWLP